MLSLNEFISGVGFNKEAEDFLKNYNITKDEYLYCRELFFNDTEALLDYLNRRTDSKAFLLKLYVLIAIDNFDNFIGRLDMNKNDLSNSDKRQIYLATMSDIRIWQEVYQRNTGKIGLIEPLWVSNAVKGSLYRFGRLQFEADQKANTVHIHIPEGENLISNNARLRSKKPGNSSVNILTLIVCPGY